MAGAGYKLFNTGNVLTAAQVNTYLMEQTVMRFATTTARDTALSGVLAEGMLCYIDADNNIYKYTGSAWVNIDTTGGGSPLTTKGDLYTYSTTDARLAVGNNGETLVADSSTSTGLRWTAGNPQGNPVINSAFQVWQRGTSVSISAGAGITYTADRWATATGANQAITVSRQATNDSTNLPFIQYCARYQRNSGQTGTGGLNFTQSMETINSVGFAGKTVTFSFYARAGANYSATSNALGVNLYTGTGTDQNILSTYTGANGSFGGTATLTTTWQRFTFTGTLSTTTTEMAIYFSFIPTGTAGANDYYEITGVQIDIGSVALPFRTYSATLAGELAACQRYYYRISPESASRIYGLGWNGTTTAQYNWIAFPVQMRTRPTALEQSGTASHYSVAHANTATTCSAVPTFGTDTTDRGASSVFTVASGLTAGQGSAAYSANASGYLGWSAEL